MYFKNNCKLQKEAHVMIFYIYVLCGCGNFISSHSRIKAVHIRLKIHSVGKYEKMLFEKAFYMVKMLYAERKVLNLINFILFVRFGTVR